MLDATTVPPPAFGSWANADEECRAWDHGLNMHRTRRTKYSGSQLSQEFYACGKYEEPSREVFTHSTMIIIRMKSGVVSVDPISSQRLRAVDSMQQSHSMERQCSLLFFGGCTNYCTVHARGDRAGRLKMASGSCWRVREICGVLGHALCGPSLKGPLRRSTRTLGGRERERERVGKDEVMIL